MTFADRAILIALLVAIGVLYRIYWTPPRPAASAVITGPHGQVRLALDQNSREAVTGALGDSVIEVADGAIRFASSPCRHQICVRSGWHRQAGAVAACVPNRVSIVLHGARTEFDALSY